HLRDRLYLGGHRVRPDVALALFVRSRQWLHRALPWQSSHLVLFDLTTNEKVERGIFTFSNPRFRPGQLEFRQGLPSSVM
ncbi:hypothetical protein, partial [Mesorhizobium sp. M7A.F.Ca.CA.001.04.1.1]|uniref:hypothetical protein n=1 Tax=Mesorhizobium sp. M7A.F.Ca.CA.001.04.1.1 TaxID=2496714 RepID=UPI0019D2B763